MRMLVNSGGVMGHVPPLHTVKAIRGCTFRQQEIRAGVRYVFGCVMYVGILVLKVPHEGDVSL